MQEDNDQKSQTIDQLRFELELIKNAPANEIYDLKVKFKELKELEKKEKDDLRSELGIDFSTGFDVRMFYVYKSTVYTKLVQN